MWPFKKNQSIDNLNPNTDKWSVLQGSADDGPMLIRINTSAQNWAQHPLLNIRVGFAVPLNQPNPGGLPDASENLVLNQLEDVISGYMSYMDSSSFARGLSSGGRFDCSRVSGLWVVPRARDHDGLFAR